MKKFTFLLVFTFFSLSAFSQVEIKINPLLALFGVFDVSGEFGVNEKLGVDVAPNLYFSKVITYDKGEFKGSGFGAVINPRYYFNPNRGIDKFYFGAYLNFATYKGENKESNTYIKRTKLAIGPNIGYKVSSDSGFIFDIGFGLGRSFVNSWDSNIEGFNTDLLSLLSFDAIGKLAIGWRF